MAHDEVTALGTVAADAPGEHHAGGELAALERALAGRYLVERELGRGGMGVVVLARDHHLERPVAIKVLPPSLAAQPELRERFVRESRTVAALSHPKHRPHPRGRGARGPRL